MVEYVSILFGALAAWFVGALWYSPLLFGTQWMKLLGKTKKDLEGGMKKAMIGGLIGAVVISFVLQLVLDAFAVMSVNDVFMTVGIVWLGMIAVRQFDGVLYEQRPISLFAINVLYSLVSLLANALVLFYM